MSDKIMENQQQFDAKAKRIREDADLSSEAKRRYLGDAYAIARDTHEQLGETLGFGDVPISEPPELRGFREAS